MGTKSNDILDSLDIMIGVDDDELTFGIDEYSSIDNVPHVEVNGLEMTVSQSLIKQVRKPNHCPKQVYYSFVEGKELFEPSEAMLMGRYFESELIGACRGGQKQEARFLKSGKKSKPFSDCDELVIFARDTMNSLGLDIGKGESQVSIVANGLSGSLDHVNKDLVSDKMANYDVKWTATKEDDRWNGWGNPEEKTDAIIQAAHYTLVSYLKTGEIMPFYFLIFGRDKWCKVIEYKISQSQLNDHMGRIADTVATVKEYASKDYKGNGSFNKCLKCPFNEECKDVVRKPEIIEAYV